MIEVIAKYQRYAEYKDSGVEWLGEIPHEWRTSQLKRVACFITGMTPSTSVLAYYSDDISEYEWVRPEDIRENVESVQSTKYLTKLGWETQRAIPSKSVLLCCIGTIGKAAYNSYPLTTNQQITSVVLKNSSSKYYFYLLLAARTELEQMATGNVVKILNSERLGKLPIPVLSAQEAQKIANFLDHETAKIDSLIEKQKQLIQLLKEKRQAVISHAVTKGLDPNVPMKDSGVEWLGQVPEHWEISRLKHILDMPMRNGLFKKKDQFGSGSLLVNVTDLFVENNFINTDNLESVQTTFDERKAYKVNYGDLFFVRSSLKLEGIGRSACFLSYHDNAVFECHVVNARPNVKKISPKYLTRYLNSIAVIQEYIRRSKTTTMTTIDQNGISSINIVVPPKVEQINIDNYLDNQLEIFSDGEKKAKAIIDLLIERRTALISAAVTGKIDVRNWQNPNKNNKGNMEFSA